MKKIWIAAGTCLLLLAGIVSLVIFKDNKDNKIEKKEPSVASSVQKESGQEPESFTSADSTEILPSQKQENSSEADQGLYALQSEKGQNRKLPKYKGLLIEASTAEVSKEAVEQEIQELLIAHAEYQETGKIQLPKKDDPFVQSLTGYGDCQTVQQLEDYIRGQLRYEKILEAIWENLINSCAFEVSEEEKNKKKEIVQEELEKEAENYEVDIDTFLQYRYAWRKTQEEFVEKQALFYAREEEFVYAVARAEGITRKGMPKDVSEAEYIKEQVKRLVVDEVKVKNSQQADR